MALGYLLKIPAASDYIFEADFDSAARGIVKKFQLPPDRKEELLELVQAVLDDVVPVADMPALLEQAFGIDEAKARAVAADLAGQTLLPLEAYLPDLEAEIVALGGKISDYPATRVAKERRDELAELRVLVQGAGLTLEDIYLKRLLFLLTQFVQKEKTEASLKTFFSRSLNIGGLGLTEAQATTLLAAVLPQAASLVETQAPTPAPVVVEAKPTAVPATVAPVPSHDIEIAPSHALAAEVPVVNEPKPLAPSVRPAPSQPAVTAPAGMKTASTVRPLKEAVDPNELKVSAKKAAAARKLTAGTQDTFAAALVLATEQAAAVLKKNKISEKVFADIAGKAIRGLRDVYQTRDLVERDWKLKGEDLATLMQAMTVAIGAYESATPVQEPKSETPRPKTSEPTNDNHKLDERFSRLTEGDAVTDKIEPAKAHLTVGSATFTTPEGQRKVVDVISSARLAGPIEQLGKMSPTEFRRLSSSAAEAAQKVEDLLSALEATSYEERVKGVLAWRDSPMNQLYLQITEEALSQGLALPEISSRRRAAGQESLSPAEMKALALLNGKIRF